VPTPLLLCAVVFSRDASKTFGPLVFPSPHFYLVHPSPRKCLKVDSFDRFDTTGRLTARTTGHSPDTESSPDTVATQTKALTQSDTAISTASCSQMPEFACKIVAMPWSVQQASIEKGNYEQ
jgi:hypothetical protein